MATTPCTCSLAGTNDGTYACSHKDSSSSNSKKKNLRHMCSVMKGRH
jgi:hypothetical protein